MKRRRCGGGRNEATEMIANITKISVHHGLARFLLLVGVVGAVGCSPSLKRPVARVGDRTVTAGELQRELVATKGAAQLLQMIDTSLIAKAAEEKGLSVPPEQIEFKVEHGIGEMTSKTELLRRLEQMGQTLDDYKAAARAELLLDALARSLVDTSDKQLRAYYERERSRFKHGPQVHARWMLFQDKASAEAVRGVLNEPGADFGGLARGVSSDSVTAEKGGDMGFFEAKDYAPEVGKVAFALKEGQISDVFAVPDGWAILQAIEKRPAGEQSFEAVKDMLRARTEAEMLPQARQQWLNTARAQARIHIPNRRLSEQVKRLIAASNTPYEPTRLLDIPNAPTLRIPAGGM